MTAPIVFKGNKNGVITETTTDHPQHVSGDMVKVKVTASGLCGTDLHYRETDMVLGHEGVGIVQETGPDAKFLKAGDRVGWGYQFDSCRHCNQCLSGNDIFCPERQIYARANLGQGSFSSSVIWHETFLYKLPHNISDEMAAPLQCAGATIFTTLLGVAPGETVGIIGIGGLGHLAIQFAAKLGCRVVVISGSDRKKQDALDLGAHQFFAQQEGVQLPEDLAIKRLLITTSAQIDWEKLVPTLAPQATIYPLSVSKDDLRTPYRPLLVKGITVKFSLVATRPVHREMLAFASLHDIKPIIETFPMTEEGINEAMDRLDAGKIRYRAVLLPAA